MNRSFLLLLATGIVQADERCNAEGDAPFNTGVVPCRTYWGALDDSDPNPKIGWRPYHCKDDAYAAICTDFCDPTCRGYRQKGVCPSSCASKKGDGTCDKACDNFDCDFDGDDCGKNYVMAEPYTQCPDKGGEIMDYDECEAASAIASVTLDGQEYRGKLQTFDNLCSSRQLKLLSNGCFYARRQGEAWDRHGFSFNEKQSVPNSQANQQIVFDPDDEDQELDVVQHRRVCRVPKDSGGFDGTEGTVEHEGCILKPNHDRKQGSPFVNKVVQAESIEDCAAACVADPTCKQFVNDNGGGQCWLSSSTPEGSRGRPDRDWGDCTNAPGREVGEGASALSSSATITAGASGALLAAAAAFGTIAV
jgi:hypothetical protein